MNAVIDEALAEVSTDVEAVLNYTRNNGVRPVNYTFNPPPGVPRSSGEIDARALRHLSCWYPHQMPWEPTLLKLYDSATDGRARLTAHTAFDEPTGAAGARPRRSIKVRSIVSW